MKEIKQILDDYFEGEPNHIKEQAAAELSQLIDLRKELIDYEVRNVKYNVTNIRNADLPKHYADMRKQAGIFVDEYLKSRPDSKADGK